VQRPGERERRIAVPPGRVAMTRRVVVTGGAGFLGSHLCERMLERGDAVVAVDDLSGGRTANVSHLADHPAFTLVVQDVTLGLTTPGRVDAVLHLASPASPPDYLLRPIATLRAGSLGTWAAVELAIAKGARLLLASTSEVYGDPQVHPQPESYWGNVNPIGPRSVYDEAKRFSEALAGAYERAGDLDLRLARIFNTYGPRMRPDDGRVVSTFVVQALRGEPVTVFGDGSQTRSFCYVDDLVEGLLRLLDGDVHGPVNLGNPDELAVLDLACLVLEECGSTSPIRHLSLPVDDPVRRRPDISRARELLGWQPQVPIRDGVRRTVAHFRGAVPAGPRRSRPTGHSAGIAALPSG
jgi:dTDP-glucose 4,6-dehydratase